MGGTRDITLTDQSFFHRRFDAMFLIVLGGLLLAGAMPVAVREMALLPHHATQEGLGIGAPLPTEAVSNLARTLSRVAWLGDSERFERLSALVARRRFDREGEIAALRRLARLAPGDSTNWMNLALELPPGVEAARALRLSALTNAFEFEATPRRVDLGLRLWPYLDAEDKRAFGRLVLALWQWETGRLAMVAARRQGYDQIAPYLAHSPEDWEHFTRGYAIHRLNPEEPYLHGPP
ncbi:MAG: hypothetical protein ABT940_05425 [Alphaproteobacteria bacterium]